MTDDPDATFLGTELRRARIARGMSQDELAAKFGFDRTVIAKAESGRRPPSPEVAAAYAKEFPELNAMVDDGLIERWAAHVKRSSGGSSPRYFGPWVEAEQSATSLFYWAPILIPGILQTEDYARTILATTPSDETLDTRVADRMARQQVLARAQSPIVSVVIAEAVLRRCVGSPEIMCAQLTHLAEFQHPKVMVQVIPAEVGAHAGLEGAVSVAEQEDGRAIVYLDSFTAGQTTGEPEIVARVREITAILHSEALPRGTSRELIVKVAEEWKTEMG